MPEPTRKQMERRFGHSFGAVRVHADDSAHTSAAAVGARAFAVGSHLIFARGQFQLQTAAGQHILAHELAHVVQQGGERPIPACLPVAPASSPLERQADAMANTAMAGVQPAAGSARAPMTASATEVSVQRQVAATDDWDFSVDDYRALRQQGRTLAFAGDSAWVPASVRGNILATLNYLYDTAGQPATRQRVDGDNRAEVVPFTGVSSRDLYHAHVVVDRGVMQQPPLRDQQRRLVQARQRSDQILAGGEVTPANRQAYTRGVQAAEGEATPLLESVAQLNEHGDPVSSLPGAAMIYHTLEVEAGRLGMRAGDPRRNILTRFDDLNPRLYSPPEPDNATSFHRDFEHVMVLSFLVDASGLIHVHPGGLQEQSLTTGRSEGSVERLLENFAPPATQPAAVPPARTTPELGRGRARVSSTVYVDSPSRPTRWSHSMARGLGTALQSWHEMGRASNFVMVGNQRFFLLPDRSVTPNAPDRPTSR